MTLTSSHSPTIGGLLLPGADPTAEIQQRLRERWSVEPPVVAMKRVPNLLAETASAEVESILAGLLDMELLDIFMSAWRKLGALEAAAQDTLWTPGEEQVVELATHAITSTHRPRVDLVVDGVSVGSIGIEVGLRAVVHALSVVVSGGKLTAIRSGRIELSATLSCEGVEITSIRGELDPSLEFHLGSGPPLVDPPAHVTLPEPPAHVTLPEPPA